MAKHFIFNEKTGKCYAEELEKTKKSLKELEQVSNNAFQWVYKDNDAVLTIEKKAKHIISATLKTTAKNKAVEQWEDIDRGQAVYDKEKKDYVLKYGLPKIFYIFINNYDGVEPWEFSFNYQHHLILKDKDQIKPHYWYYYDYTDELSNFVYEILNPFIKNDGEIVLLPSEQGQAGYNWTEAGYNVNDWLCGEDEEYKDYDFSRETAENWQKNNLPTSLLITFLPTSFKNYELDSGVGRPPKEGKNVERKLTGTTWFKKIWQVFGARGVPIVLKCYEGFYHINLFSHYKEIWEKVNSICKLPTSINGREVGGSNYLLFFNCPFLPKKITYEIL